MRTDQTRLAQIPDLAEDVSEEVILEDYTTTGNTSCNRRSRVPLMYGGDPGFAFEYGGSWADWHDQHRDQMPVEQYIKTKLPKAIDYLLEKCNPEAWRTCWVNRRI